MEIILIRHGKPTTAINPKLNALGYIKWVKKYNSSLVSISSVPPKHLHKKIAQHFVVSSDLKRAVHSAVLCTNLLPKKQFKVFREMDIPRYKLPFTLNAYTWLYLNRFLWTLGLKGKFESLKSAKKRAELAADLLIQLAIEEQQVALFSHGYLNIYLRKALQNKGWQMVTKSNQYWGETKLIKNS